MNKSAEQQFRYLGDPLCLLAAGGYLFGRVWLRPQVAPGTIWHDQFTDFWLIPAALPPVLWLHRQWGLRRHDRPPAWHEILFHLCVWTITAEVIAPAWSSVATADWRDAVAYAAGAVVAGIGWKRVAVSRRHQPSGRAGSRSIRERHAALK